MLEEDIADKEKEMEELNEKISEQETIIIELKGKLDNNNKNV